MWASFAFPQCGLGELKSRSQTSRLHRAVRRIVAALCHFPIPLPYQVGTGPSPLSLFDDEHIGMARHLLGKRFVVSDADDPKAAILQI